MEKRNEQENKDKINSNTPKEVIQQLLRKQERGRQELQRQFFSEEVLNEWGETKTHRDKRIRF